VIETHEYKGDFKVKEGMYLRPPES
jgi:hypothetical protein